MVTNAGRHEIYEGLRKGRKRLIKLGFEREGNGNAFPAGYVKASQGPTWMQPTQTQHLGFTRQHPLRTNGAKLH